MKRSGVPNISRIDGAAYENASSHRRRRRRRAGASTTARTAFVSSAETGSARAGAALAEQQTPRRARTQRGGDRTGHVGLLQRPAAAMMQLLRRFVAATAKDCKGAPCASSTVRRLTVKEEVRAASAPLLVTENSPCPHRKSRHRRALLRRPLGLRRRAGRPALRLRSAGGEVVVADVAPPAPYSSPCPSRRSPARSGSAATGAGAAAATSGSPAATSTPRPGYAWEPHRWVQHDNRWHLEGGGWARR